jgi:hypothetical protein
MMSDQQADVPPPQSSDVSTRASEVQVCLAVGSDGEFRLEWSAKDIGEDDWVGLYANVNDGDGNYIKREWQWARDGNNYQTGENVQAGFQARYMIPNGRDYVSIARTSGFPSRVCS